MKEYDFIVVGSGCGLIIVDEAVEHDLKVALVDTGPLGGTCLNVGCIPSKMLTTVADRVVDIQEARKLGVRGRVTSVDFQSVMRRMRKVVSDGREHVRKTIARQKKLEFYEGKGCFVDDMTMEVNGEKIKGKRIFLASGSRTLIPPIRGLETVDYLTNESVLNLKNQPESLVIIGGGYIAVELGHFLAAMGTRVTILEMADRLILSEEPEISELLKERLGRRLEVRTGELVQEVRRGVSGQGAIVLTQFKATGEQREYSAERILVAVGRRSNADTLRVEKTGVQLDQRGFIKVNGYMQTSHRHIFAVGDANGQQMFTHIANREAVLAADHVLHGTRKKMDYGAAPHAVYSYPQIASVGMTEEQARMEHKIRVGKTKYRSVAYGEALIEKKGFAKAVIEEKTDKILGFHIIGPYAPILIQEVINAMQSKGNVYEIFEGMHIHPAMTELIPTTLGNT
ncbi:MAG: dihydrolipoyl dehydrogenase [Dehalococcoidia bacterium]